RDSKAARRLESSCRTRARGDLSQGGCAVAKARGKRLGTPDAAGAVERMRVARKAGRRNVLSIIQEVQAADPSKLNAIPSARLSSFRPISAANRKTPALGKSSQQARAGPCLPLCT